MESSPEREDPVDTPTSTSTDSRHQHRPRQSDFNILTQKAIAVAIVAFCCHTCQENPWPDSVGAMQLAQESWNFGCDSLNVKGQPTLQMLKMVCDLNLFVNVLICITVRLDRELPMCEVS